MQIYMVQGVLSKEYIWSQANLCFVYPCVDVCGKHRYDCIWRNAQKICWILSHLAECLTASKTLLMTGTSNAEVPRKNVQTHQQQSLGRSCSVCV